MSGHAHRTRGVVRVGLVLAMVWALAPAPVGDGTTTVPLQEDHKGCGGTSTWAIDVKARSVTIDLVAGDEVLHLLQHPQGLKFRLREASETLHGEGLTRGEELAGRKRRCLPPPALR